LFILFFVFVYVISSSTSSGDEDDESDVDIEAEEKPVVVGLRLPSSPATATTKLAAAAAAVEQPQQQQPGRGAGGRGGAMNPQGGRGGGGRGGGRGAPMQQGRGGIQPAIKFNSQVRNARPMVGAAGGPMMSQQVSMGPPVPPPSQEPLTAAALASASPEIQKNMIGERIYPLIHQSQPELAGKITGMLLEMDNSELLHLLESPEALNVKIAEALHVLEAHKHAVVGQ